MRHTYVRHSRILASSREGRDLTLEALSAVWPTLSGISGPDAGAEWIDGESGIALGHRRLSIFDLSPAGAQPMEDNSGRFVIAFNGEIYNHLDLRRRLEDQNAAPAWRGHSDTENSPCSGRVVGRANRARPSLRDVRVRVVGRANRARPSLRDVRVRVVGPIDLQLDVGA